MKYFALCLSVVFLCHFTGFNAYFASCVASVIKLI